MKNYKKKLIAIVFMVFVNIIFLLLLKAVLLDSVEVTIKSASTSNNLIQLFYSNDEDFSESDSIVSDALPLNVTNTLTYKISTDSQFLRLDFQSGNTEIVLESLDVGILVYNIDLMDEIRSAIDYHNCDVVDNGASLTILTKGEDPYIILDTDEKIVNTLNDKVRILFMSFSILFCIGFDLLFLLIVKKLRFGISTLVHELKDNHKLIWSLSKNDFKTKFAGSYFGIFWAFVQPIVTTMIYVFVFQVGFKAAPEGDYPYVLWLIAGIIPWFFFVEGLINATNCLIEYSYLVKKVVFKISILPIVKIISSLFVHLFFIAFVGLIYVVNGKIPGLELIQIIYYCICIIALITALSYITMSIVPFFKDFSQIVSILTQIGMWMIPIMWNKNMLAPQFQWILKLNPMYYVVEGYRDSFIYGTWFWEKPAQTFYFWACVVILFIIGTMVYNKLKVHFSDVL